LSGSGWQALQLGGQQNFVTARELVNILHAAEVGHSGNPGDFRDFCYTHS